MGSLWASMPASRGRRSLQLHHHALEGFLGFFVRDLQQLQDDGLVLAQHVTRGDAKQQGVTNLTCSAGDGNTDGLLHGGNSELFELRVKCCPANPGSGEILSGKTPAGQFVLCLI
jgi:hypothetical protein